MLPWWEGSDYHQRYGTVDNVFTGAYFIQVQAVPVKQLRMDGAFPPCFMYVFMVWNLLTGMFFAFVYFRGVTQTIVHKYITLNFINRT